ncbi:type II toxin-antitoxin system RelE/ParE family toxin [Epilithonimonas sp.]|uniref:type II toxin-antitoxin system RelE/ParE family toxin n=1 Tax=Epilithonimonas sp. TaxID=2894511 RepID=UPI00289B6C35|nr:type II toxin-antitoxin system RelE/ParE family toxin [Epilithonimonas sp.]
MWTVLTTDVFNEWLEQQDETTQEKVLAALVVLQSQGPSLGRPLVDTVYGSKYTNMKELRVQHRGKPIRAFFAFDPLRQAIVLCIGDKSGNKRFYTEMLAIADEQYSLHLKSLGVN